MERAVGKGLFFLVQKNSVVHFCRKILLHPHKEQLCAPTGSISIYPGHWSTAKMPAFLFSNPEGSTAMRASHQLQFPAAPGYPKSPHPPLHPHPQSTAVWGPQHHPCSMKVYCCSRETSLAARTMDVQEAERWAAPRHFPTFCCRFRAVCSPGAAGCCLQEILRVKEWRWGSGQQSALNRLLPPRVGWEACPDWGERTKG